jgi:phospholipase/carboxylesterase
LTVPAGTETLLLVPAGMPSGRLLVFFHGAGGRAARTLPALEHVAAEHGVAVLLPTSSAATWDLIAGGWGPDVASLDAALAAVFRMWPVERLALAGFSDGASYALSLGLANGDLAEAVIAYSPGFQAPPRRVGAPRVFVSHGLADRVLPIDRCGRRVARELQARGYEVEYDEFADGHVLTAPVVRRGFQWWVSEDGTTTPSG